MSMHASTKGILRFLSTTVIVLLVVVLSACDDHQQQEPRPLADQAARKPQNSVRDAVVARVELVRNESGRSFRNITNKLSELRNAGFNVVWLSPVFQASSFYQNHLSSDPYPTEDFNAVDEGFGTLEDFKSLLRSAHDKGMNVIVDLPAKYTAWDSKLLQENPEWFRRNQEGGILSPKNEWTAVADFNYEHHELRKYMIEVMKYWFIDVGVDGFVCLHAELVPTDFWTRARKELERSRPVILIAESSLPEHHLEAFDATVDGGVETAFTIESGDSVSSSSGSNYLEWERSTFPRGSIRLRCDRPPTEFPRKEQRRENPRDNMNCVLAYTVPGIPVVVFGPQWIESVSALPDRRNLVIPALSKLRATVVHGLAGEFSNIPLSDSPGLWCFQRRLADNRVLVLVNYTNTRRRVSIQLPAQFTGSVEDYLRSETIAGSGGKLNIVVDPLDAKVIVRSSKGSVR
jgi:glycosidase